jgi:ribokinase
MMISFGKSPKSNGTVEGLCVVGNLTIDVILRGVTEMPQWGQEVLCGDRTESVAGQAGALAFAASAMGISTDVVSAVGNDAAGMRIRDELMASGINVEAVALALEGSTQMTVALVRPDGERAFVSDLGKFPGVDVVAAATKWLTARPAGVVALVGTSNLPRIEPEKAVELFRVARQAGALTVFDPGWDPFGWPKETVSLIRAILSETDLFLPNLDEATVLTGKNELAPMFEALTDLCPGVSVVKAGASGSYIADKEQIVNVHAIATSVDNAVGAGDVFDGGLVAGYLNGMDILGSAALASAAASIYVGRRVNRFPDYGECTSLANVVEVSVGDG